MLWKNFLLFIFCNSIEMLVYVGLDINYGVGGGIVSRSFGTVCITIYYPQASFLLVFF